MQNSAQIFYLIAGVLFTGVMVFAGYVVAKTKKSANDNTDEKLKSIGGLETIGGLVGGVVAIGCIALVYGTYQKFIGVKSSPSPSPLSSKTIPKSRVFSRKDIELANQYGMLPIE